MLFARSVKLWDVAGRAVVAECITNSAEAVALVSDRSLSGRKTSLGQSRVCVARANGFVDTLESPPLAWQVTEDSEGQTPAVRCLSISPDGLRLATGGDDGICAFA